MIALLALRRARRDIALLLVWIALVAAVVLLAIAQPRLLLKTVDQGARQAVAAAGSNTDVVITTPVGNQRDAFVPPIAATKVVGLADAIPRRLPAGLRDVRAGTTLSVLGPSTPLLSVGQPVVGGPALHTAPIVDIRLGMVTPQNEKSLHIVSGRVPGANASVSSSASVVDVVLSAATASAAGLARGETAEVSSAEVGSGSPPITIRVVGIAQEKQGLRPTSAPWQDTPNLWSALIPATVTSNTPKQITALTDPAGITTASRAYSDPVKATIRLGMRPSAFTSAREAQVSREVVALIATPDSLGGSSAAQLSVSSQFGPALADFPARERAATAQISIMAAGVLGVAAVVLLLVSRLLVLRRMTETRLDRARGASLVSIGGRALLDSAVLAAIACAVGVACAAALFPGAIVQPGLLVGDLVVAVLAIPVQTILLIRSAWAGRRTPANAADRADAGRAARARRIAIEVTVLALAIASFVSLVSRGLLETQTSGVDPLLASAPLLVGIAVTIGVLRVYRYPLRLAITLGRRSVGAVGLLAAVRAQRSIAILPLLSLTLAVALAVGGGLLGGTVSSGQESASWQRIGADVRVDAPISASAAARVAKANGVTDSSALYSKPGVQLRLGGGTDFATLVGTDSRFAHFVATVPAGGPDAGGDAALAKLNASSGAGAASAGSLNAVVSRSLAAEIQGREVGMYFGVTFVSLHIVGLTDESPGFLAAPFVFVDRSQLASTLHRTLTPTTLLVNGPGAAAAVAPLHPSKASTHTRADWLSQRRHLALVAGVNQSITLATTAIALLAILALIISVLNGARERGRSLSLVRTLGLPARLGWPVALAEVAPVLLAALIGGVVAGVGTVLLLEPTLGLRELAGGLGNPAPTISALFVLGLVFVALALLAIAVLVEVLIRRRDRLSETLRVGEN